MKEVKRTLKGRLVKGRKEQAPPQVKAAPKLSKAYATDDLEWGDPQVTNEMVEAGP